jgi:hypothetical protein
MPINRRRFLRATANADPLASLAGQVHAESPVKPSRITRLQSPVNLEMSFAGLDGFIAPNQQF